MSRERKLPHDPADPRRAHDPGRGLRSHVADAGVPVQPPRPDPAAEAAESDSGPEYDADGVHRDDVYPDVTRALLKQQAAAEAAKGARPPRTVAQAILWIEDWRAIRLNSISHRPGTGPAYRAEGEATAIEQVLNLLRYGDPEPPTGASS